MFELSAKNAVSSSRIGSEGRYMRGTLPVAVCFNSVNVFQEDGSIKRLCLDTFLHFL